MSLRAVLLETLLVLLAGVALGLGVNAARDDGLDLARDHFPQAAPPRAAAGPAVDAQADPPDSGAGAATASPPADAAGRPPAADPARDDDGDDTRHRPTQRAPLALVGEGAEAAQAAAAAQAVARLEQKGLSAIDLAGLRAFLDDPMFGYGLFVLLDARRPAEFARGHLPGARHYDPYHPDAVDPVLLAEIQAAQRVVVYCNGGQCEDSETAALQLLGAGVSPQALQVYVGGWEEWTAADLPVERPGDDAGAAR